jgi:hypothetical protein
MSVEQDSSGRSEILIDGEASLLPWREKLSEWAELQIHASDSLTIKSQLLALRKSLVFKIAAFGVGGALLAGGFFMAGYQVSEQVHNVIKNSDFNTIQCKPLGLHEYICSDPMSYRRLDATPTPTIDLRVRPTFYRTPTTPPQM